jgi:methionyl-tRNA formyltransferase
VYLKLIKKKKMSELKVLILCNNPVAVPGIREFLFYGKLAAVVTTKRNKEMQHILSGMLEGTGVPLILVTKKECNDQLRKVMEEYKPDVVLMMTFPFIINGQVLQNPPKGFINFHYGLLPQCRGPQPILWHMLNNDAECGVTVHKADEGVDTGDIILQEKIPIDPADTYGTLQSKLAYLGAKQAATLLKIISYGNIIPATKQDETKAAYFEMPKAEKLSINWSEMNGDQIVRLVNACNPWNKGAGAIINNWMIGITAAQLVADCKEQDAIPGTILACNDKEGLLIKTADDKKLRLEIVYLNEGFFLGHQLTRFGIMPGMVFM